MSDSTTMGGPVHWPMVEDFSRTTQLHGSAATDEFGLDVEERLRYDLLKQPSVPRKSKRYTFITDEELAYPFHMIEAGQGAVTAVRVSDGAPESTFHAPMNLLVDHGMVVRANSPRPDTVAAGPHPSRSTSDYVLGQMDIGAVMLVGADDTYLDDTYLNDALADLDCLDEAAREDDLPIPAPDAVANARWLLPRLYAVHPVRYRVAPTERRGVAIDAPMKREGAVGVECGPNDTVYCFATIGDNSRRAKYYQMDGLPDVFIEKALRDLAAG